MLYKTAGTLHYHLRYTLVMLRKLIKGRIDNLYIRSLNGFLYVCYLLRTLIDEKNDQMHIFIIFQDRLGYILQEGGLSCFRRGNDHTSLSLSDGADKVHDTHCCCSAGTLHDQPFIREDGCHVFKIISLLAFTWVEAIDRCHVQQCAKLFSLSLDADISLDNVSCFQIESSDLGRRNIDVILSRKIVLTSDKSKSIWHNLQNTVCLLTAVKLHGLCRHMISTACTLCPVLQASFTNSLTVA